MSGRIAIPARQNLLGNTDLSNGAWWGLGNCTITPNAGTAPDGSNTAYLMTDTVSGVVQHALNGGSGPGPIFPPGIQCFSCYVKAGTKKKVALRAVSNGWSGVVDMTQAVPTFSNTVLTGDPSNYDWWIGSGVADAGNGWFRIWNSYVQGIVGNGPANGNVGATQRFIYIDPISYAGDGTGTVYLWGPQLNQGLFPTPYIANSSGSPVGSAPRQPRTVPGTIALVGYGSDRTSDDALNLSIAPGAFYRGASPGLYNAQGIWTDLSGNARHTTPQSASRPSPRVGINQRECLYFGAVSNQALIIPAQNFDTFTLFVVFKLTGSNGQILVTKSGGFPDGGYLNTSYSTVSVQRSNVQVAKGIAPSWAIDNVARSAIMTYGGSLATLNLYIGGVLQSQTTTATGTMAAGNLSQQIFIGASESGASAISGFIGEVRMYPGVLTAADIAKLTAYSQSYWRV